MFSRPLFAVGITLSRFHYYEIYHQYSGSISACMDVISYSYNQIKASLQPGKVVLFDHYADADAYCHFLATSYLNTNLDLFVINAMPAVMPVMLTEQQYLQLQPRQLEVSEFIPPCSYPPEAKKRTFNYFTTPNITVTPSNYALFANSIFTRHRNIEFWDVWSDGIAEAKVKNTNQIVSGLKSLFESYHQWPHHWLTRHNHKEVKSILDFLEKHKNLPVDELTIFFELKIAEASANKNLNQAGHYKRMLNFAFAQLNELKFTDIPTIRHASVII